MRYTVTSVSIKGSSEFPMGKSQTMVKNMVQEYFFMAIFKWNIPHCLLRFWGCVPHGKSRLLRRI